MGLSATENEMRRVKMDERNEGLGGMILGVSMSYFRQMRRRSVIGRNIPYR